MFNFSPQYDPKVHACLVDLQKSFPYPFVYAEAQLASGGPPVKRWMIKVFGLTRQRRIDDENASLKAMTWCPFCGQLLAIGSAEDLLPKETPEEAPAQPIKISPEMHPDDRDLALENGEDPL